MFLLLPASFIPFEVKSRTRQLLTTPVFVTSRERLKPSQCMPHEVAHFFAAPASKQVTVATIVSYPRAYYRSMDVVGASWRPTTLRPGKAMLADLFSCVGAGDVTTAKALLEAKTEVERVALLSATNPSGITLLQHACHNGQADGLSMLLDKASMKYKMCKICARISIRVVMCMYEHKSREWLYMIVSELHARDSCILFLGSR